ncbi:MAG: LptF/LptG family permease [Planctomycetaceae bacterium]
MTTFDRYLLRRFLHVFGILFVASFGLFVVIDGFTNVNKFQDDADDLSEVLGEMARHYGLQSSMFFDMAGPTLAVVTVMIVLTMLVRHSEAQPIFAAGIPVFRLLVPLVTGVVFVNVALSSNQEFVIPRIAHKIQAVGKDDDDKGDPVEPAYDNNTHIHIGGAEVFPGERRMRDAEFTLPAPEIAQELVTLKATAAHYLKQTEGRPAGWLLKGVSPRFDQLSLTPHGGRNVLPVKDPADVFIVSPIDADMLHNRTQNFRYVSTPELIRRIRNPAYSTDTIRSQSIHLHSRLTKPILSIIAVLITVPLILMKESRNVVGNVALCTLLLGALFAIGQGFEYLGSANLVSAPLAAWGPVILDGTIGAWLFGVVQT